MRSLRLVAAAISARARSRHVATRPAQRRSGHERGSLIVTTNLPFGEWTKVFPDARMAKAVVDRLTHRIHIIDTGNESWRFRQGLQTGG
jgi:DNA replication protein DnaC